MPGLLLGTVTFLLLLGGDKLPGWGGQSEQGFAPRLRDRFNLWSWDFTLEQGTSTHSYG